MIKTLSSIALLAAFAVSGTAFAQKAAETSNTPQRAGEASTMTGGAPNAKTTNDTTTSSPADKAGTKSSKPAKVAKAKTSKSKSSSSMGGATETSNAPERAGEASTMTGGVPNKKTTN
jgi:hypothetical protein